jgi:hypothetical protein
MGHFSNKKPARMRISVAFYKQQTVCAMFARHLHFAV